MAASKDQQMQSLALPDEEEEFDISHGNQEDIVDEELDGRLDEFEEDADEEIDFVDDGADQTAEDNKFDQIIGALEDLLISPEFEEMQSSFCLENCHVFEDDGENKLSYTAIFEEYTSIIESTIEEHLTATVEGFNMLEFAEMLESKKEEGTLDGDVFDMLMTMTEFEAFKELILSYKQENMDTAKSIDMTLSTNGLHIYKDEQEDGEERPDLDMDLTIVSLASPVGKKLNTRYG